MPIQPTIIVGVGGQGTMIATSIYQRLLEFASQQPDAQDELSRINRHVRVFAVDTTPVNEALQHLPDGHRFVVAPQLPDRQIAMRSDFFREWWPRHITQVGAYDAGGAGQIRAKGRLAYYADGGGQQVAGTIIQSLDQILHVQRMEGDHGTVYVYLIGSVSGGTGSGILLTLAMHLRHLLEARNAYLLGVIPLASIMAEGTTGDIQTRSWTNAYAALREIDWWMTPPELRAADIAPFFQIGNSVISGVAKDGSLSSPFDLCYLYTKRNRADRALTMFEEYAQLIADSIALELNSPLMEGGTAVLAADLANTVSEPARPSDEYGNYRPSAKPIGYASTSCAALVYPAHAITDHLALRFLDQILDHAYLRNVSLGTQAQDWVLQQQLDERRQAPQVRAQLRAPRQHATSGARKAVGARPRLTELDAVKKSDARPLIDRSRKSFDENWCKELSDLIELNKRQWLDTYREEIWQEILNRMTSGAGAGFPAALQFIRDLETVITDNKEYVDALKDGREEKLLHLETDFRDATTPSGRKGARERLIDTWGRLGSGEKAKIAFKQGWWTPYTETREQLILDDGVIWIYQQLIEWLEQVRQVFAGIQGEIGRARQRYQTEALHVLGRERPGRLVNEFGVLDDPASVNDVFGVRLRRAAEPGSDIATSRAQAILQGLRALIDQQAPPRHGPIDSEEWLARAEKRSLSQNRGVNSVLEAQRAPARAVFADDVDQLGLWGALTEEFNRLPEARAAGTNYQLRRTHYILDRLTTCVDMAVPFWKLDVARVQNHRDDFPVARSGIIVYSDRSLRNGTAEDQQLAQTIAEMLTGKQEYTASTDFGAGHTFYVAMRERGAPLFMLDHWEREEMARHEARVPKYIDQRYYGVLPPDFEPRVVRRAGDGTREALVLARSLHDGFLRLAPNNNGHAPSTIEITDGNGGWACYADDIGKALSLLKDDPSMVINLEEELNARWDAASPKERRQAIARMRAIAFEGLAYRVTGSPGSDDRKAQRDAWQLIMKVVNDLEPE